MPRLLSTSEGFEGITDWRPVNGPNARNSGSTTASDGTEQTFDAYGDLVSLEFTLNVKRDRAARRQRGLLTALRAGNAMRLSLFDPDMMSPAEAGITVGQRVRWTSMPAQNWSNGMPWSNGQGWTTTAPLVSVSEAADFNSGEIVLSDEWWGRSLGIGDILGFLPFHFGMYTVSEVMDDGRYRIWPRLRRALTDANYVTLHPVIAMRPTINTLPPGRGLSVTEAITVTMVEVPDYYIRESYEG